MWPEHEIRTQGLQKKLSNLSKQHPNKPLSYSNQQTL